MTAESDVPGIDDDHRFRRREHLVERVGWGIMLAIVVAAVLGAFGHGLFSYRTVEASDGSLAVDYERMARKGGPTGIDVSVRPPEARDRVSFTISRSYLQHVDVESITPEPLEMTGLGDGVRFAFAAEPGVDELTVRMQLRPDALGAIEGGVRSGDSTITFRQFVLP